MDALVKLITHFNNNIVVMVRKRQDMDTPHLMYIIYDSASSYSREKGVDLNSK